MLSSLTRSPLSPPGGGFVCLKPPTAALSFAARLPLRSLFPLDAFILRRHHRHSGVPSVVLRALTSVLPPLCND